MINQRAFVSPQNRCFLNCNFYVFIVSFYTFPCVFLTSFKYRNNSVNVIFCIFMRYCAAKLYILIYTNIKKSTILYYCVWSACNTVYYCKVFLSKLHIVYTLFYIFIKIRYLTCIPQAKCLKGSRWWYTPKIPVLTYTYWLWSQHFGIGEKFYFLIDLKECNAIFTKQYYCINCKMIFATD